MSASGAAIGELDALIGDLLLRIVPLHTSDSAHAALGLGQGEAKSLSPLTSQPHIGTGQDVLPELALHVLLADMLTRRQFNLISA